MVLILLCMLMMHVSYNTPFTLMIDPARDAYDVGRIIDGDFERGVTLQCARDLQKHIEVLAPTMRVILTRYQGESLDQFNRINYANRLEIDAYITIHCYQHTGTQADLSIYYCMNDQFEIVRKIPHNDLFFISYYDVHAVWSATTKVWATKFHDQLVQTVGQHIAVRGVFGIPFKPLLGINAPALAFELGVSKSDEWRYYSKALAASIVHSLSDV